MNIHSIGMGISNSYLLQSEGVVLIDSGPPGKLNTFAKELRKLDIDPEKLSLVINTHGHMDHIGSAGEIQKMTGAQIAMHGSDTACLEKGEVLPASGVNRQGRILARFAGNYDTSRMLPAKVDIVFTDEEFSLVPFGIPGKVIHTPGHTAGSVSIVLETGDTFVGDLAMNGFPFHLGPGLPIIADDLDLVKKSWAELTSQNVKTIYPGHGKPCSIDAINRVISRNQ